MLLWQLTSGAAWFVYAAIPRKPVGEYAEVACVAAEGVWKAANPADPVPAGPAPRSKRLEPSFLTQLLIAV